MVNVYSEANPGRQYLEIATDELSPDEIESARADGQALTLREAVRLGYRADGD